MGTLAKTLATSALAAGICGAAWADDDDAWRYYATGANKSKFYLHKTKFRRVGEKLLVWTKSVPIKPTAVYENQPLPIYSYTMTQHEINCGAQTVGVASLNFYGKDGSVVASKNYQFPEHISPAPDTINEALLEAVCGTSADTK